MEARLEAELGAEASGRALRVLREVLRFDAEVPKYTKEIGRRNMASRAKRASELGVTVSQLAKKGVARLESERARASADGVQA